MIIELDSTYQKTYKKRSYSSSWSKGFKSYFLRESFGGHFEFMQIRKIAQSCHSGNKAEYVLGTLGNMNQEKNFIGKTISRLVYRVYRSVKPTIH